MGGHQGYFWRLYSDNIGPRLTKYLNLNITNDIGHIWMVSSFNYLHQDKEQRNNKILCQTMMVMCARKVGFLRSNFYGYPYLHSNRGP